MIKEFYSYKYAFVSLQLFFDKCNFVGFSSGTDKLIYLLGKTDRSRCLYKIGTNKYVKDNSDKAIRMYEYVNNTNLYALKLL